ncbi:MAG: 50S ribosomal protein L31 [Gammaproteobacteria bacterium]|jgi:large subunit ribosomal protein L31
MKPDIHPTSNELKVTCSCGNEFTTQSILNENLHIDVCNKCHPFYTGQQKIVDTTGRVEKFNKKYDIPGMTKKGKKEEPNK